MPVTVTLPGTRVTFYHPVLLARSKSLAVTAVLPEGPRPPGAVVEASIAYLRGDRGPLDRLHHLDRVLAYALLFGGLQIVSLAGDPAPLARLHVNEGLALGGPCSGTGEFEDTIILEAYSLVFHGREEEGLSRIAGCTVHPARAGWTPGGPLQVLPLGYRSEPA